MLDLLCPRFLFVGTNQCVHRDYLLRLLTLCTLGQNRTLTLEFLLSRSNIALNSRGSYRRLYFLLTRSVNSSTVIVLGDTTKYHAIRASFSACSDILFLL